MLLHTPFHIYLRVWIGCFFKAVLNRTVNYQPDLSLFIALRMGGGYGLGHLPCFRATGVLRGCAVHSVTIGVVRQGWQLILGTEHRVPQGFQHTPSPCAGTAADRGDTISRNAGESVTGWSNPPQSHRLHWVVAEKLSPLNSPRAGGVFRVEVLRPLL